MAGPSMPSEISTSSSNCQELRQMISRSYSSMNKLVDFYNELVQQELRNLQSELRENKPRCLNDHRSQLTEALDLRHLDSIRPMSPHLKVQRSCSSLDIEGISSKRRWNCQKVELREMKHKLNASNKSELKSRGKPMNYKELCTKRQQEQAEHQTTAAEALARERSCLARVALLGKQPHAKVLELLATIYPE